MSRISLSECKFKVTLVCLKLVEQTSLINNFEKIEYRNTSITIKDVSETVLRVLVLPQTVRAKEIMFHALHEIY